MTTSLRRTVLPLLLVAAVAGAAGWWLGRGQPDHSARRTETAARRVLYYQSPMHPWIRSERPGNCTICGMKLAPVYEGEAGAAAHPGLVVLPASSVTTIGIATEPVARRVLQRSLRVAGTLDDDETKHRFLSARVPGRIEKLFVHYVGAEVRAGEPLATIYSPELLTAQREYLQRFQAGAAAYPRGEVAAARERLLGLGLEDDEVAQLERSGEPVAYATVRAPYAGTIVARDAYVGHYVKPEDHLFTLGDFAQMWFLFQAYEQDLAWLRVGQSVEVSVRAVPGRVFTAPIDFIDPNLNATTRSATVRVILDNPREESVSGPQRMLPHRAFAEGIVQLDRGEVLALPRSAVLDSGTGPLAYVQRDDGTFEQRRLRLGQRGDVQVEVLAGLQAGEKVVTHGALLIDAQAQLAHGAAAHAAAPAESTIPASPGSKPTGTTTRPSSLSPEQTGPLNALIPAIAASGAALAADDLGGYQRTLAAVRAANTALEAVLAPAALGGKGQSLRVAATNLAAPATLEAARQGFEPYSTIVADIVREARGTGVTFPDLHLFECPMSPQLGRARWIQTVPAVRNPFFGSAMLTCGEELK